MEPIPDLAKDFSLVVQEERQRSMHQGILSLPEIGTDEVISSVSAISSAPTRRDNLLCSYCKRRGHTKDKCYKLNGFPPGYNKSRPTRNQSYERQVNNTAGNIPTAATEHDTPGSHNG